MGPKVLFHDGIHTLSLAVGFGVERGTQAAVDPKPAAQPFPEGDGKLRAAIRGGGLGQTVGAGGVLEEQVCQIGCVGQRVAWHEVAGLG